jgi:hypothetical protein
MSQAATQVINTTIDEISTRFNTIRVNTSDEGRTQLKGPIEYKGSLDGYKSLDLTPVIGREYSTELQLQDLIEADDDKLRDFASVGEFPIPVGKATTI